MTQKEVAISLGVSTPTVSDWENCNKYPTPEKLKLLSELFLVSIDYLLGCTDDFESSHFSRELSYGLLKDLRLQRNETVQYTAKAVAIPVNTYEEYENSKSMPTPKEILRLSKHFGISPKALLGERFYITSESGEIATSDFSVSLDEQNLIELYRQLNPQGQLNIMKQLEFSTQQDEYKLNTTSLSQERESTTPTVSGESVG